MYNFVYVGIILYPKSNTVLFKDSSTLVTNTLFLSVCYIICTHLQVLQPLLQSLQCFACLLRREGARFSI